MSDRVVDRLAGDRAAILRRLFDFVRHPSVGADPGFANGMRGAQDFLVEQLRAFGFCKVQLLEAGGQPAVYGEWRDAPGRPTLLVYGHYDVQPPDPLELWARRTGRVLGWVALFLAAVYLVLTYGPR